MVDHPIDGIIVL